MRGSTSQIELDQEFANLLVFSGDRVVRVQGFRSVAGGHPRRERLLDALDVLRVDAPLRARVAPSGSGVAPRSRSASRYAHVLAQDAAARVAVERRAVAGHDRVAASDQRRQRAGASPGRRSSEPPSEIIGISTGER